MLLESHVAGIGFCNAPLVRQPLVVYFSKTGNSIVRFIITGLYFTLSLQHANELSGVSQMPRIVSYFLLLNVSHVRSSSKQIPCASVLGSVENER